MPKTTAQDIKDLGFTAGMFSPVVKQADSEVIGTDGRNYVCILDHIAADDNKPVTGASWQTYWALAGSSGAAWATATNYKASFKAYIDAVIVDREAVLEGRIGTSVYNSATLPTATYVKNAARCFVAADMVQRRINIVLGNAVGGKEGANTSAERRQRQDYLDEMEMWIAKIVAGTSADSQDFASGSLITSHFE